MKREIAIIIVHALRGNQLYQKTVSIYKFPNSMYWGIRDDISFIEIESRQATEIIEKLKLKKVSSEKYVTYYPEKLYKQYKPAIPNQ